MTCFAAKDGEQNAIFGPARAASEAKRQAGCALVGRPSLMKGKRKNEMQT